MLTLLEPIDIENGGERGCSVRFPRGMKLQERRIHEPKLDVRGYINPFSPLTSSLHNYFLSLPTLGAKEDIIQKLCPVLLAD